MRMCPPAPRRILGLSSMVGGRRRANKRAAYSRSSKVQRQAHIAQRGEAVTQHQLGQPHVGQLCCVVARQ